MDRRKGTVILGLLVVILLGGVLATRLVPSYEIQERRQSDLELRFALAQIRQAVDMKEMLDPDWPNNTGLNLGIASQVKDLLNGLIADNLLGAIPRDTTIITYQWSQNLMASPSQAQYWVMAGNIASNSDFEDFRSDTISGIGLASWSLGTTDTLLATVPVSFPDALDDYKGQNKFGRRFSPVNYAIQITK